MEITSRIEFWFLFIVLHSYFFIQVCFFDTSYKLKGLIMSVVSLLLVGVHRLWLITALDGAAETQCLAYHEQLNGGHRVTIMLSSFLLCSRWKIVLLRPKTTVSKFPCPDNWGKYDGCALFGWREGVAGRIINLLNALWQTLHILNEKNSNSLDIEKLNRSALVIKRTHLSPKSFTRLNNPTP